jgi:hypothetical protein
MENGPSVSAFPWADMFALPPKRVLIYNWLGEQMLANDRHRTQISVPQDRDLMNSVGNSMRPRSSTRISLEERLVSVNGRPTGFDFLRVLLATSVVVWHSIEISYGVETKNAILANYRSAPALILPMFFSLSGFLVAGSLNRESNENAGHVSCTKRPENFPCSYRGDDSFCNCIGPDIYLNDNSTVFHERRIIRVSLEYTRVRAL